MNISKNDDLLDKARKLRREMTSQERKMWYLFLRRYPAKIYKQRIIGSYIVDFYCASAKLVIEIDGGQHFDPNEKQKDLERTAYFESFGLRVARYSNADINERFANVCESLQQLLQTSIP